MTAFLMMEYEMIELATLPPIIQQYIQENDVVELRLVDGEVIATPKQNTSAEQDEEMAYYEHFYRHFDIEQIKQSIGETDENGRAKHTVEVPKSALANFESFQNWLSERKAERVTV